jgi:monoamine oxidase
VIITLPLGVLQQKHGREGAVRFVPELPAEKRSAFDHLVMGPALKIILVFRERFWEGLGRGRSKNKIDFSEMAFMHYTEVPFSTWWTQLPVRAPVLVGWVGGPTAEVCAEDGDASVLENAISSLAEMLNVKVKEVREELESWFVHDWQADPFSRGAYSYLPVDGLKAQQALIEPVDSTLFFAGEATAVGHVGTVHGAVVSAKRVVKKVADQLK